MNQMDFENVNPNVYYPSSTLQSTQFDYKYTQNQYPQPQYQDYQGSYQMSNNYSQMGQPPMMQQYPPMQGYQYAQNFNPMGFQSGDQTGYMMNNGMNPGMMMNGGMIMNGGMMMNGGMGNNETNYQNFNQNIMPQQQQNPFEQGGYNKPQESQNEEEDKVDPDFKPDEVVDEESEDDDELGGESNILIYIHNKRFLNSHSFFFI